MLVLQTPGIQFAHVEQLRSPEVNVVVNGWQVASTLATSCAAIAALIVAIMNTTNQPQEERRRYAEGENEALAQARLVVMGTPIPDSGPKKDRNSNARHMRLAAVNHSKRAIVDVAFAMRPRESGASRIT